MKYMKINPKKLLFVATLLLFAIPSKSWAINITVPQPNNYGDVLIGTNNKTYTPVATSTLGIVAGGFSFPFTVRSYGVSTSTVIGFTNGIGLFTTGSTTLGSTVFIPSLSQGLLYIGSNSLVNSVSTSTLTATSPLTGSFVQIGSGGALGCQVASGSQAGCLSSTDWNTFNSKGSGTLTAVTGTFPIFSSGGTTPNITFGGLSTSSLAVIGNIPYFSSANTFANVATGTITCTGTASCTTTGLSVIGGNLTITGATSGSGTISTSSPLVAPQVLYATGVNTVASAATSTLAIGSSLSNSGALGFQIGGSASSLSINTANTNTWSVLQNFLYSSTTGYASFQVSSSTSLIGGTLTLPNISGTQCLHSISGVVSGTGSDCGSGGSSSAGPINTLQASNGSGGFIATGTPQLTVGNLISTTTIASSFLGDLVIGNNGVDGGNVGSGTILKNDGTIETTGTIENLNTNQDLSIANTVGRDILFKTSLTNSLNTTMTVYRSGLVGIGIAAPSYQLEVASSTIGNKAFIGITDPSAGTDKKHWWLANEGGNLYIGTSTDALATSSTNALGITNSGQYTISTTTAGCLNTTSSGLLYSATCSSGSGTSKGPVNTLQASDGSGGFIATGTPQLTVGNLVSTSTTATSTFAGPTFFGTSTVGYTGFTTPTLGYPSLLTGSGGSAEAIWSIGNVNNYFENYITNRNNGNTASTDYIAANNQQALNAFTYYMDMGIDSSGYSNGSFIGGANDGYLYNSDGALDIGTASTTGNFDLRFETGGMTNDRFIIKGNGLGGFATTTLSGVAQLTIASSTAPELSLSNGAGVAQWVFNNAGGNLYIASSTVAGTATSSISALNIIGSTGLVGIATDTPFAKLSINPQAGISSFVIGSSTGTSLIVDKLGNVGIGLANPSSYGTIAGNFNPSNLVVQGSTNNTGIFINTATHSASGGAGIIGYSDSGAALVSGDRLGFFLLGGSENSAHELDNSAGMIGLATQTWTNTAAGSQLQFQVTPNNSETRSIAMTIDQSGDVGIGTTTPTIALDVVGSGSNTASGLSLLVDSYTPTPSASPIVMRVARGTSASPTAIQSGDIIGGFNSRPFGQNTFAAGGIGGMIFVADQNYSNTAMGSYGAIFTTPDNTVTNLERMRILSNGYGGFATATPTYEFTIASSTGPQLALSASSGLSQWTMANEGGNLYFSTTTVAGTATTTPAALGITSTGQYSISTTTAGNLAVTSGGLLYSTSAGTGSVTNVAGGQGLHGGPITTTGTLTPNSYATIVVSTSTATGDFTDVQTALNAVPAGGATVQVTCGTFALSATTTIKTAGTILQGSGVCTEFTVNGATIGTALGLAGTDIENVQIRNLWIHQTNGTHIGYGIDASNTPLLIVEGVKLDGFATSTRLVDTANLTFYQNWSNMDLRDNNTCIEIGGNPVNDNTFTNIRCAPTSGGKGYGLYVNTSGAASTNGAQSNTFNNFDSEPTGASTNLTGIYASSSVDTVFNNVYLEGNAIGVKIGSNVGSNAARVTFIGGQIITCTTSCYVNNNSQSVTMIGTDIGNNPVPTTYLSASTTFQDITNSDASSNDLSFQGNANWAKSNDVIFVNDLINGTDSGNGVRINNAGTGAGIRINSTGTGQAGTTTGTWFMHGLAVSTSGNAVCINTSTFSLENAGAGACVVSTLKAKHDISTIDGSIANEVMNLNPVEYTLNGGDEQRYGFIAEEAAKIDPKLVEYAQEDTSVTGVDGKPAIVKKGEPLTFDYARYTGLLTKFVQDEQKQIDNLKVGVTRSVEENYQWIVIGLLVIWNVYLTKRKR